MRLRRDPEPSPETVRELEAVEAALAGEPVGAEHQELRDLALALRAERPQPRPEFTLELDLRAREGFAQPAATAAPATSNNRLRLPLRRAPLALATAASLFIVATAVLTTGVLSTGGGQDEGGGASQAVNEDAPLSQSTKQAPAGGDAGSSVGRLSVPQSATSPPLPVPPGNVAPGARRREVERAAELTLATGRDRVEDVADEVIRVTDRHRGFVLSSSVSAGDRAKAGATLELRIPGSRLQTAVADLSELAHVRSRTQSARDITGEFSSPRRRLADALAERRGLLRQLAAADTPNETAAVRARLRAVNRRIDRAQAELRSLRERVSFASVAVTIEAGGESAQGGDWTLGDAVRDAVGVLGAVAGAAIVGLAVALPLAILAAIAWLAYGALARRRRERVLDTGETRPAAAD
jgi:Domain of unknown function (DUF4349)